MYNNNVLNINIFVITIIIYECKQLSWSIKIEVSTPFQKEIDLFILLFYFLIIACFTLSFHKCLKMLFLEKILFLYIMRDKKYN